MKADRKPDRDRWNVASWIVLILDVLLILFVARDVLVQRAVLGEIFSLDEFDVPATMRLALMAPTWAIKLVAAATIFVLAIKEFLLGWKSFRLALNLAALVGGFLVLEAFQSAVIQILLQVA